MNIKRMKIVIICIIILTMLPSLISDFFSARKLSVSLSQLNSDNIISLEVIKKTSYDTVTFFISDKEEIINFLNLIENDYSRNHKERKIYDNMFDVVIHLDDYSYLTLDLHNDNDSDDVFIFIRGNDNSLSLSCVDYYNVMETIVTKYLEAKTTK